MMARSRGYEHRSAVSLSKVTGRSGKPGGGIRPPLIMVTSTIQHVRAFARGGGAAGSAPPPGAAAARGVREALRSCPWRKRHEDPPANKIGFGAATFRARADP